ncbi:hypothetical protein [Methylobacterium fujisawaense]
MRLKLRAALACALLAHPLVAGFAHAAPPLETNQLVDSTGAAIGTPADPLMAGTMQRVRIVSL